MTKAGTHSAVGDRGEFTRYLQAEPELGWWPRPNASFRLRVLGRDLDMAVDEFGYRPVPGQPVTGEKTLAMVGCSFTFGWAIPVEETACAILQSQMPTWRIENHGMIGFGSAHNLIQLRRLAKFEAPDFVSLGWIPHHRYRAVADAKIIQGYQWPRWQESPISAHPKAYLDANGEIRTRTISFKRPELRDIDLTDFEPDPYYLDLVTFRVFQKASELVGAYGGKFFVTVLRGALTSTLRQMMSEAGILWVDASIEGRDYSLLPDDGHPNGLANRIFAQRIEAHIRAM